MASEIDPQLLEQLERAKPEDEVEAFIIVASEASTDSTKDSRGPAGALVDRVTRQLHEQPSLVRFLPRLGVVVVRARPRLVRALIKDSAVVSASAGGQVDLLDQS